MTNKIGAIILGAGNSERMQGVDKLFSPLGDKLLIAWSFDLFQQYQPVNQIVMVFNEQNIGLGKKMVDERNHSKITTLCIGGKRRQDSVWQGLKMLNQCEWVIIHDGARPFITRGLLEEGIKSAMITGAAVAAVPVKDTIKLSDNDGLIIKTLPRNQLWAVQTPQVFRIDIITTAYNDIKSDVTDDASLVEKAGFQVKIFMGSYRNIKITTPDDLNIAISMLGN